MDVSRAGHRRGVVRGACVAVALALIAAACGSDDEGGTATTAAPVTTAASPGGSDAPGTSAATETTAGTDTSADVTTTAGAPTPSGEPKRGGTITIGVEAETDLFDPFNGNIAQPGRSILSLIMGALTASDDKGNYVPYMAKTVESNADASEWTIGLYEGMLFSDGEKYDAAAVKKHIDRGMNDSLSAGAWPYITAVEAVDELTVKFTFDISMSQFPQVLADAMGNIISPKALDEWGEDVGNHPVGAGPYMVEEFVRDDHLTLVRNPNYYFGDLRGYADTIIFRPIPDDAARAAALEAGDVDVIATANPGDIQAFKGKSDEFTVYERSFGASGLLFSVTNIPDIRIRTAAAMAIDKEAIRDLVYNGIGESVETPWPADSQWYFDVSAPEFDIEGATALVDEVKAEGGDISIKILSGIDETSTNYKTVVAEQLRAVGLEVEIETAADVNDQVNRYIEGNYEIYTAGVFAVIDPWFEYTRRFKSDSVLNGTGFKSEELDAALELGAATTDQAERKEAYDTVQELLATNVVQIFVHGNTYAIISNKHIQGFATGKLPDGSIGFMNFFTAEIADEYWRDDV